MATWTLCERLRRLDCNDPIIEEAATRIEELEADLDAATEWLKDLYRDGTITAQSPYELHQTPREVLSNKIAKSAE